jgi:two-component sensor histidine kinase
MDEHLIAPAILPPAGSGQKRLAFIVALLVPIPFIAILPIGQLQLPRVDSFIPVVDTAILINDSITATLLLALFTTTRLRSLLALAAGFLFTALLIVPHALTLPGAFASNGLLGARLQTPAWLNEFWHLGLPSAVIAYALLKRSDDANSIPRRATRFAIFAMVGLVFALTCTLLWLTTEGVEFLPPIMTDLFHSDAAWDFIPPVALSIAAITLLWPSRDSALDLWLLVVLEIWMLDAFLFYKLTTRYSLLWYGGRAFATFAASLVLLFLLSQTTVLYGRLARSRIMLKRSEETNRLLIAELQHRTRNLLSVVSSLSKETLASCGSLSDFADTFDTRLAALSRVQGLLFRENTNIVTIGELVRLELQALGAHLDGQRVTVGGPEVALPHRCVQILALSLHELATNARKYGALGTAEGRLAVTWRVTVEDGNRHLALEWRESGVALYKETAPARKGFGRTLIEESLPYQLDAKTRLEFGDNGVCCSVLTTLDSGDGDRSTMRT